MKSGDSVPQHCDNCHQLIDRWGTFIMVGRPNGTWTERVDGSEPAPGDLCCCYGCSEQLEPPMASAQDDLNDDIDDDWSMDAPTDATYIYLLLRNKLVVYVGIGYDPDDRMRKHWKKKGLHFDDVIETPDSPYCRAEAERREKILIRCYRPIYNTVHNYGRITKEEEREFLGWLSRWPEGNDAMCARIARILRNDLVLRTYAYPLFDA
jgi:hypothetical protein